MKNSTNDIIQILNQIDEHAKNGNLERFVELYEKYEQTIKEYKRNNLGENYLHYVARLGKSNILDYLVEMKFDIDVKTIDGSNILHRAASSQNFEIIKLLVEKYKFNPNYTNNSNCTPLLNCLFTENLESTFESSKYLIDKTDLNICDIYFKYNPLFVAGLYENYYIGKLLIEINKIDYNHVDRDGLTIEKFLEKHLKKDPTLLLYLMMNKN